MDDPIKSQKVPSPVPQHVHADQKGGRPLSYAPAPKFFWSLFFFISIVTVAVSVWVVFGGKSTVLPAPVIQNTNTTKGRNVHVDGIHLPLLSRGHYQLWVSDGVTSVSAGIFTATQSGELVTLTGAKIDNNTFPFSYDQSRTITKAFITIEADSNLDNLPSSSAVLSGTFENKTAILSFTDIDIHELSGSYILATPTDDPVAQEESGVWFFLPGGALRSSLVLPEAPAGWTYEAWVTNNGRTLSAGRFSSVAGKDNFSGYSGGKSGPAFPGEDFLRNPPDEFKDAFPLNLADGKTKVTITIEPDQKGEDPTGPEPFPIQALEGSVPLGLRDHVPTPLRVPVRDLPAATITLK